MSNFFKTRLLGAAASGLFFAGLAVGAASAESLSALLGRTHVHGLSLDPDTTGSLFLASHHGLFRADLLTLNTELVGTSTDDFMGFSPVPSQPGTAYASGHPKTGGSLGILKTEDGGTNWRMVSPGVSGPVDFHQMASSPADPLTLYGVYGGDVQQSRDGGETWAVSGAAPAKLIAISGSSIDPLTLYAATETGLLKSRDGGRNWAEALDGVGPVSMINVGADGVIYAFQLGRGLIRGAESAEGGDLSWVDLGPAMGRDYLLHFAREPGADGKLFALTGNAAIVASLDGGKVWALVARP